MFFLGSGSSILPYLISLVLIWGVFLLNGILENKLKKVIDKKSGVVWEVKNASPSMNKSTCSYEDVTEAIQHQVKSADWLNDFFLSVYNRHNFYLQQITGCFFKGLTFSFFRRGPPF
jgi:hypothetical protein